MDRRNFLKSVTGVATAAAAGSAAGTAAHATTTQLAAPGLATDVCRLRIGLTDPANGQGVSDFALRLAAAVRAASETKFDFDFVHLNADGIAAVADGHVDGYCASDYAHQHIAPELAFFAGLPGRSALDSLTVHHWLSSGGGQELWDDISAELGIKALACAATGPSAGLWFAHRTGQTSSLAGRTIFAQGLARDVVTGLGAQLADCNAKDVHRHLRDGTVDVADVGGVASALALGVPGAANMLVAPAIYRQAGVVTFGIKKSTWDRMSAGQRATIEVAAASVYHESCAFARSQHGLMTAACRDRFHITQIEMAPELANAIAHVSDSVIAHLAASSPRAARINMSYMAFRRANGTVG